MRRRSVSSFVGRKGEDSDGWCISEAVEDTLALPFARSWSAEADLSFLRAAIVCVWTSSGWKEGCDLRCMELVAVWRLRRAKHFTVHEI